MAWIVGVLVPLYLIILLLAPLLSNPALLGSFCGHLSVVHSLLTQFDHQTLSVTADFYLSVPFIFKNKKQQQKKTCLFWLLGDLIILIPSQFNSVLFVLSLYACTAVPPHPTARFDSLGDVVSVSHLPSASTGHVGCCVICSLCHQEVWCQSSPAVCIARVLLLPWHLFPYTSWTLHFMNCIYKLSDLNFAGTGCPIL